MFERTFLFSHNHVMCPSYVLDYKIVARFGSKRYRKHSIERSKCFILLINYQLISFCNDHDLKYFQGNFGTSTWCSSSLHSQS